MIQMKSRKHGGGFPWLTGVSGCPWFIQQFGDSSQSAEENAVVHHKATMMKCTRRIFTFMAVALACSGLTAAPIEFVNVMDYGALANGKVDDTSAVQKALDAAVEKGGICFLPAGSYRLEASLTVPAGVTLRGSYDEIPHPMHPIGTVLHIYGGKGNTEAEPAIILDFNASVRNIVIHYPEQQAPPDVIPYPWTIQIRGQMCQVVGVAMTNPYRAIDAGTHVNELHVIRDVYACPLNIPVIASGDYACHSSCNKLSHLARDRSAVKEG